MTEQVETLLKTQDPIPSPEVEPNTFNGRHALNVPRAGIVRPPPATDFNSTDPSLGLNGIDADRWGFNGESPQPPLDAMNFQSDLNMGLSMEDNTFSWEMIGLGLEEPLPPQDTIDELYASLLQEFRSKSSYEIFQTSNILRQNPPFFAHDPQVPISCCHEPVRLV